MRSLLFAQLVLSCSLVAARAGLLAYYPFDSDFSDLSGNANHLTAGAGTPMISYSTGEHAFGGGALDLESTTSNQAYLNLAVPISFGPGSKWSVAFWARHRPGNDGRTGMIAGDLTNTDFIWIPRDGAVDGIRFRNSSGQNADYTTPPAGVEPAGVYHHWAVVADGAGSVEVYYDNASLGTRSIATTFSITSVAQAFNQNTQSMNGQIDELYIYDEAISPAKVNELFTGSSEPDMTAPALSSSDIADDAGGGPVAERNVVTYTLIFSEDMDSSTVEASDFYNAGSAPVDIGSITEVSPGLFTVPVTPTDLGTLRLAISAGAVLTDPSGNLLDTSNAIIDDTEITVEDEVEPPAVRRLRVCLLGGQSNAVGRGDPSRLPTSPVNLQLPQADVDFFYGSTLTTLRPLSEFGPEITLGRSLADSIGNRDDTRAAIIKYGVGGTSLKSDWRAGGDESTSGDGPRYVSFQQVVSDGLAALAAAYPDAAIELEGMVWVQGERDARNLDHGEYAANLSAFIADVRNTYGAGMPFVVVRLSSGQTNLPAGGLDGVRAAQTEVAMADPSSQLVDSDSFGLLADALHFDALGQQQFGDASARLLLDLLPFTSPPMLEVFGGTGLRITVDDAFPGFIYTLQTNRSLRASAWLDVESIAAPGSTVVFDLVRPAGELSRYFRVARSLNP